MNHTANASLDCTTMQTLENMLHCHHPGIGLYKQAIELTRDMGPDQQCKISLHFDPHTDCHCYNFPTATSNEIAAILPRDGDQVTASQDIVLYKHGGGLQGISDIHPLYPSLHYDYVLLFPNGDLGWHPNIFHMDIEDPGDDHQEESHSARIFQVLSSSMPRQIKPLIYGWKTLSGVCCGLMGYNRAEMPQLYQTQSKPNQSRDLSGISRCSGYGSKC